MSYRGKNRNGNGDEGPKRRYWLKAEIDRDDPLCNLWVYSRDGQTPVTVLQEILEWSYDRPTWQRDALRRLVLNGELSDDDIDALTDLCKSAYGLAEQPDVALLAKDHVPVKAALGAPVSLLSIFHHRGVNALAEDQTLRFGPHLTVVYGDNAAGKSGYIRILKSACRARSQEQILGNVTCAYRKSNANILVM